MAFEIQRSEMTTTVVNLAGNTFTCIQRTARFTRYLISQSPNIQTITCCCSCCECFMHVLCAMFTYCLCYAICYDLLLVSAYCSMLFAVSVHGNSNSLWPAVYSRDAVILSSHLIALGQKTLLLKLREVWYFCCWR